MRLKQHFRSKWAQKMADASGYTPSHIRRYFSSDICNPEIANKAIEVVELARKDEKEFLKNYNHE